MTKILVGNLILSGQPLVIYSSTSFSPDSSYLKNEVPTIPLSLRSGALSTKIAEEPISRTLSRHDYPI